MVKRAVAKVRLINNTKFADSLLVFSKNTRLTMTPDMYDQIVNREGQWTDEKISEELDYMANTIPSSWEFCDYYFLISGVSRAFTHQFVRNRTNSYAQQTMRVLDMCEFDYVFTRPYTDLPTDRDPTKEELINMSYDFHTNKALEEVQKRYNAMIEDGVPAEDARGILPTNIATNILAKINLRTFADMAKSRTGGRTQGEYQMIMNQMVDEVLKVHPWAEKFFFKQGRDYFKDLEDLCAEIFGSGTTKENLHTKGRFLKIIDKMRKG
ncbi:thymidylate synthase protein [Rhizobium phage RHph_TM40]|nr:thymidylate synthase protein [Rhizobium phage RHph_TM40]QIG77782.1 thymidylate synthase protein [Rhizobium phage RHph_TM61]